MSPSNLYCKSPNFSTFIPMRTTSDTTHHNSVTRDYYHVQSIVTTAWYGLESTLQNDRLISRLTQYTLQNISSTLRIRITRLTQINVMIIIYLDLTQSHKLMSRLGQTLERNMSLSRLRWHDIEHSMSQSQL